jgi:hypothetical protein
LPQENRANYHVPMRKTTLACLTLALALAVGGSARLPARAAAEGAGSQAAPPQDLALDQIKMASGFKIELFATGVANACEMALGSRAPSSSAAATGPPATRSTPYFLCRRRIEK